MDILKTLQEYADHLTGERNKSKMAGEQSKLMLEKQLVNRAISALRDVDQKSLNEFLAKRLTHKEEKNVEGQRQRSGKGQGHTDRPGGD